MSLALILVVKSTVLLSCAAVVALLCGRGSASTRHAVWTLAIVSVLVLPIASSVLPKLDLPLLPIDGTTTPSAPVSVAARLLFDGAATPPNPGGEVWVAVWFLGFSFVLLRLVRAQRAVRKLKRQAAPAQSPDWMELTDELRSELAIAKPVCIVFHNGSISPMTWGVRQPVIVLPAAANDWPADRKRLVLAHELAHVKRRDGITQLLGQLACSLYWFNPMVWYAAYRLCAEREQACDDQVLLMGNSAADYADHLVEITRSMRRDMPFSFSPVSMAQPSQLESRVLSILNPRASRRIISRKVFMIVAVVVSGLTLLIATIGVSAAIPYPPEPPIPTVPVNLVALSSAPPPAAQEPARDPERAPYRVGGDVTAPTVISKVEPDYTPEARGERIEGSVLLEAIVFADGTLKVQRVIERLEYGLTEEAVKALEQWKFKPALRNGKPVDVSLNIEVNFNLR